MIKTITNSISKDIFVLLEFVDTIVIINKETEPTEKRIEVIDLKIIIRFTQKYWDFKEFSSLIIGLYTIKIVISTEYLESVKSMNPIKKRKDLL